MLRTYATAVALSVILLACSSPERYTPFNDPDNRPFEEPELYQDIEHYDIELNFDLENEIAYGMCRIRIAKVYKDIILLDAKDMIIKSIELNNSPTKFTYDGSKIGIETSQRDNIAVVIRYESRPKLGMFFTQPNSYRQLQVYTQGETEYNSYWFPCHDYPNDKATLSITATVPDNLYALSNGELVSVKKAGGLSTYKWRLGTPTVSYLAALVIGEFDIYEDNYEGVPLQYMVPKGQFSKEWVFKVFGKTPEMMNFLNRFTGFRYPYEKYAQVLIYDFMWGGMENVTCTTLNFDRMKKPDPAGGVSLWSQAVIAHELAHQWFGDLITCRNWFNLWLNEGFASYFDRLWVREDYGENYFQMATARDLNSYLSGARARGARNYQRPIVCNVFTHPDDMFDSHTYAKGGMVLGMLRNMLGDMTFKQIIKEYVSRNKFSSIETSSFQECIEDIAGQDLDWFFNQWIYGAGHPKISYGYSYDPERNILTITMEQKQDKLFKIPVEFEILTARHTLYRHKAFMDGKTQELSISIDSDPLYVDLNPEGVVIMKLAGKRETGGLLNILRHSRNVFSKLRALKELSPTKDDIEAIGSLQQIIRDKNEFFAVRSEAIETISGITTDDTGLFLLALYPILSDNRVKETCIEALSGYEGAAIQELLKNVASDEPSPSLKAAAFSSLGEFESAADFLLESIDKHKSDPYILPSILSSLSKLKKEGLKDLFLGFSTEETHHYIRSEAIKALGDYIHEEDVYQRLSEYLSSGSDMTKGHLLAVIQSTKDPRLTKQLPEFIERESHNYDLTSKAKRILRKVDD